ncbi:SpoIIE family protein phosphatase [Actinoplanes xinjiangensis]|uniref:Serine phosphatase RsbU (Regulator of sigma subunit) n=1 Tax=Actinoplanes xinjiangensis TaxID=512350 RepID=A0A316F9H9_9ACTN|nr:SpoIIE family protein phosphatase [Actinoplanes xinjiangensis]PWK43438.1 serine phosphatase RsbU (regulator of sigma subunit) [Actinoplanes xinjiangensis]
MTRSADTTGTSEPAPPPAVAGRASLWHVLTVVVVAYSAGASLAFVGFGAPAIVVLFLPAGVTLSALVLNPRRRWPWILAAIAVTEIVVDVSQGMSVRSASGFALANTAEPLVGALLLRRNVPGPVDLRRRRDLLAFLGCCVVAAPIVGGAIGATTLVASVPVPWPQAFVSFWAGDATGVLTVAGCVLAWRYSPGRSGPLGWVLSVGSAVAATVIGFWPQGMPLFYLPIPVLFALAFSRPLVATLTAGLATTVTANLMTSTGHGPWAALDTSEQLITMTLQLFLATTILGAWALAVGVAERDRARSDTSVERAARLRLHALQVLTTDLAKAATSEEIAQAIVREGIGLIADHGSVALAAAGSTELVLWTTDGRPADMTDRYRGIPAGAATPHSDVMRTGRPVIHQTRTEAVAAYPHLEDVYRTLGVNSGMCVPIDGDAGALGSLAFSFHREHGADAGVIAFAVALATLSGQALRRAQMYERERDATRELQQALLPTLASGLPGIQVCADYRPADVAHQVGGDWYDVFAVPAGRVGFAVGDVVGHQLAAAAAMARLQSALRILAQTAPGPAGALDALDRASTLIPDAGTATVGYADYDPATRLLRYACAGHLPPLLVTGTGAEYLWGGRSLPLGVGRAARGQGELVMPHDAILVWYTDGLVERADEHIAENMQRLADAAGHLTAPDAATLCRHLLDRMAGAEARADDTAILCIQFAGPADAQPYSWRGDAPAVDRPAAR